MGWFSKKVAVVDSVIFKVLAVASAGSYNYALDFDRPFSKEQMYKVINVVLHDVGIEFDGRQNSLVAHYVTSIVMNINSDLTLKKFVIGFANMLKENGKVNYEDPSIKAFEHELSTKYSAF